MRILAILTVRNEAPFLLEWLAHHQAAGFTDFLVLSNDCADGTDAMLDRLQALGLLAHLRVESDAAEGVQWTALKAAARHPLVRAADWIMALDIDEFVNVHAGDRTVPALIAAVPGASAIALTWRIFGNAGVVRFEDHPVQQQFTRAAAEAPLWPQLTLIKTLFRNDGSYAGLGVHRPRRPDPARLAGLVWVDGNGQRLPKLYRDPPPMLGIATDPKPGELWARPTQPLPAWVDGELSCQGRPGQTEPPGQSDRHDLLGGAQHLRGRRPHDPGDMGSLRSPA
jgi:hypothetical protein